MNHRPLTLLAPTGEIAGGIREKLAACGIRLQSFVQAMGSGEIGADGVLLTSAQGEWDSASAAELLSTRPGLLLVYGDDIPYGWADHLDGHCDRGKWEVVRLAFVSEGERALIGGEQKGYWVNHLRRRFAYHQLVCVICKRREVDEAVRQLPRYLAWKERFFLELGEVCDREGVSLQTVVRALGMDTRVGQGWLYPERSDQSQLCQWLEREAKHVLEKANVHRVVLWGPASFWNGMETGWLEGREVCVVSGEDELDPNEAFRESVPGVEWQKALRNADLLLIGRADAAIGELRLSELVQCMRQSHVVDACACFPIPEARTLLLSYRAVGEKTNVWE